MQPVETPLGTLWLSAGADGLTGVTFARPAAGAHDGADDDDAGVLSEAAAQLDAYFAGELRRFEVPLAPRGTAFQQSVWVAVARIPYGATASYGEVAATLRRPSACRAVGAANGRNPLPIVIPCHRVVGSAGALTGYGGGLERKRALLDLEAIGG
jgi:methylated-DNA-[protein]-cysteine S-methyltransferase